MKCDGRTLRVAGGNCCSKTVVLNLNYDGGQMRTRATAGFQITKSRQDGPRNSHDCYFEIIICEDDETHTGVVFCCNYSHKKGPCTTL